MKLFTIGDSISQGFMSAAAARTEFAYSTLIASQLGLGLNVKDGYSFPTWEAGGLPLNLELIMRALARRYGRDINAIEWLTVLQTINDVVNTSEEFYERGPGALRPPRPGGYGGGTPSFDNVSVRGFDVADSWLVTPEVCREVIGRSGSGFFDNGYLTGPDFPFYRTALKVLNPTDDSAFENFSQMSWLERHATKAKGGVENLILWHGANNALGTVLKLSISQTPDNPARRPVAMSHVERAARKWNLWHPNDFDAEYEEMFARVDRIMRANKAPDWRVFIGTVPMVTIAPLAKGVGDTVTFDVPEDDASGEPLMRDGRRVTHREAYYKFYTYFPFDEAYAQGGGSCLNRQEALLIDNTIRQYNRKIKALAAKANREHGAQRYHIVDLAETLRALALKRNEGNPSYEFPRFLEFKHPMVDTKYYFADTDGRLRQGGLFSLDGVHPTPILHGLIAWEFLKVMRAAGVKGGGGGPLVADFTDDQWRAIFANDLLYSSPIPLMQELFAHRKLAEHLLGFVKAING